MSADPHTPSSLNPHARACLEAIASDGSGGLIRLGGAIGLAYFLDYRSTADADAWWSEAADRGGRQRVTTLLCRTLDAFGRTRVRSWGDVTSIELIVGDKAVFSFQIADRSARLREAVRAPWPDGILLDHLDDLLAGKMEALVNRGAPRDFRDVRAVCGGGLSAPARLWELWAERRDAARQEKDPRRAALAVRTHLERIENVRPLESIGDEAQREQARDVRTWIREEFLRGLV